MARSRILVVRLGAMGDIIHTLPAAAALQHTNPDARITWVVEPRWEPLLEDNPYLDRVVLLHRESAGGLLRSWRDLRTEHYGLAIDFQGLMKSALTAAAARPDEILGFHPSQLRERGAALLYSRTVLARADHVVERNLELVNPGNVPAVPEFPLPCGRPEGVLPLGEFVLASPLAGWRSKQWPMEYYEALGARLRKVGIPLVLNGPPGSSFPHQSGLTGLIYATRRAAAVVGVDSGPLHLAAALGKPGVAIFGPTDPDRNGPYGSSIEVLRADRALTTYKRGGEIDESMRQVSPDAVFEALHVGCLS